MLAMVQFANLLAGPDDHLGRHLGWAVLHSLTAAQRVQRMGIVGHSLQ
jgi:hypothetical protein